MKPKYYFQRKDKNLGDLYEEEAGPQHKYYVKVKTKQMVRLVKKFLKDAKKLNCLSIGCGTGEAEAHYASYFNKVIGIDYSKAMIAKAKKLNLKNTKFKVMNATKLDFKDNYFEVIVIFNVLHHVQSYHGIIKILKESERVLKNNGILLIYEMNPFNPVTRHVIKTLDIDKEVNLNGFKRNKFPTTLSPKQLKTITDKTNLKKITDYFLIFFPKMLGFLNPLETFFEKIPLGGLYVSIFKKS